MLTLNKSSINIVDAGVLHHVDNMSDHAPIYTIVKVEEDDDDSVSNETDPAVKPKPKPSWKKASPDQRLEYEDILFRKLATLHVPQGVSECSNVHCDDPLHKAEIDSYIEELLKNVNDSGFEALPISKPGNKKSVESETKSTAGWKQFVEPYQDNARFWHSVWKSADRPLNTELHKIMKTTRNRYHYQARKCHRVENFIKNQKIVENCLENDMDLFAEIKRQRSNDNEDDVTIDGAAGKDIPGKFAEVYDELYNRCDDDEKVEQIKLDIKSKIGQADLKEVEKINSTVIKEAMDRIKSNKSDPLYEFSSDFLKHAPDILYEHLALVIKSFVMHAHVTSNLLVATLVPIVKDKLADLCSSKNYRSIAISSLILKLMDWVILLNHGHLLKNNYFQFGFQQLSNTSLCSWMVYETIDQYLSKGSTVYGCLLDCTKAFDTVLHSLLFQKLLDAGVPPIIVRLLISMYRNQAANVRWKGQLSEDFLIRNGVRQGAVISPILFSFYMDNLFDILKKSGSGCMVGSFYAGCFGYADDLFFLCPSRGGLQEMLNLAQEYVKEQNIAFSTDPEPTKSKTKGIIFTRRPLQFTPEKLQLDGNPLPWIENAKYLGNNVSSIPDGYAKDARQKRAQYIERNIEIMQEFPFAHPEVKCRLNRIYNSSFPGAVLYNLSSDSVSHMVNSWSVSVRQMWGLPRHAHRYLVRELGGQHAEEMLITRYVKFLQSIKKSPKLAVQFMLEKIRRNVNTVTGTNIRYIQDKVGYHRGDVLDMKPSLLRKNVRFSQIKEEDLWRVTIIKEIVNINQNTLQLKDDNGAFLTFEQLNDILEYVSTS